MLSVEVGLPLGWAIGLGVHGIAAALFWRGSGGGGRASGLVVGLLAALCGASALGARLAEARADRPPGPVTARIEADIAAVTHGAASARVELRRIRSVPGFWGDARVPRSLELFADRDAQDGLASRPAGCRVRAWVRIAPVPSRRNPGSPDPQRVAARHGVSARGRLLHPRLVAPVSAACRPGPLARFRAEARQGLARHGLGGAGLAALALGEDAALPTPLREAFARLGIAHLLAVSGLHLAWVAGLAFGIGRTGVARLTWRLGLGWDGRRVGLACAWAAAAVYVVITGAGVPVRRAFVLLSAVALAALRRRPARRGDALALAASILLWIDPAVLFAVGAQLSFAATAALVHARPEPIDAIDPIDGGRGLTRRLAAALRVTATALLGTAPLLAWHFGQSSPLGLLTNLVAVPLVGAGFLPLALLAAGLAPWPGAEAAVAWAAGWTAACLEALPPLADAAPPWPLHRPGLLALTSGSALACVGLRVAGTGSRLVVLGLVSVVLAWGPAPDWPLPGPAVVAFDVGQGDAVLVRGRRATVLVDGGAAVPGRFDRGRSVVVPALLAWGVRRLDLVVATHADSDHRGGLPAVLRSIATRELWLPHGGTSEPGFAELVDVARELGVPVRERGAGSPEVELGDLRVAPLWPPRDAPPADRNARSLIVRIALGAHRVLLPGDAPREVEQELLSRQVDLRAELLVVGHHGSRTSTGPGWLRAVAPRVAIVSAPWLSRFGFPHREVRERLERAGVAWCWTGRDGAVALPVAVWGRPPEARGRFTAPLRPDVCSGP